VAEKTASRRVKGVPSGKYVRYRGIKPPCRKHPVPLSSTTRLERSDQHRLCASHGHHDGPWRRNQNRRPFVRSVVLLAERKRPPIHPAPWSISGACKVSRSFSATCAASFPRGRNTDWVASARERVRATQGDHGRVKAGSFAYCLGDSQHVPLPARAGGIATGATTGVGFHTGLINAFRTFRLRFRFRKFCFMLCRMIAGTLIGRGSIHVGRMAARGEALRDHVLPH